MNAARSLAPRLLLALICLAAEPLAGAQPATAPAAIAVPGSVEAFEAADLYAKASGYVAEVKADIGDHVKRGDLLAVIDNPELQNDLVEANALLAAKRQMVKASDAAVRQAEQAGAVARQQLASFQADQRLAQVTLKRQEELFAGKAATDQQLDEARAKAETAAAAAGVGGARIAAAAADLEAAQANRAVAAAQADVAAAQVERAATLLRYTRIVAPFDGVITRRWATRGDLVQAATATRTTPLFTCQRVDVVRIFCDVPESAAAAVRAGDAAEVKLYGQANQTVRGTVTRLATAIDPASRTMRVEVDLPNPRELLRPGMYAQVTIAPGGVPATHIATTTAPAR